MDQRLAARDVRLNVPTSASDASEVQDRHLSQQFRVSPKRTRQIEMRPITKLKHSLQAGAV